MSARASLLAGIPYAAVVALLLGQALALPLLALGWAIALVAIDEPSLSPRYGRHADVGRFQRTALGAALTYRRGWVPSKVQRWVWPCAVGFLFAPGVALAWLRGGAPTDLASVAIFTGHALASPLAVLSAAFIAENLLVQPLIAPFLGLGVLGALVASATRPGPLFQNVAMGLGAFVALLFALDLVRLLRSGVKADGDGPLS